MSDFDQESMNTGVMAERLRNLDATINRLEKRLFGNGTPGELAKHEARIVSLESMVYKVQGVGIALVAIIEILSHFIFRR